MPTGWPMCLPWLRPSWSQLAVGQGWRRPQPPAGDRDLGLPGRTCRRADLLPDHHPEPDPAALVGTVRHLEGRPGDLGRYRRGDSVGIWYAHRAWAPGQRSGVSPTQPPPACWSPRRLAGSATTSTRSCSASPPRSPGGLRSPPPTGRPLHPFRHLPAHVSVRDHLGPEPGWLLSGCRRIAGSGPRASSPCTSQATRRFGCSRRRCGSTTPTTSWGCGSTSGSPPPVPGRSELVRCHPAGMEAGPRRLPSTSRR